jgi:hypothetical protein
MKVFDYDTNLREFIKSCIATWGEFYVLSFSELDDDLNMWKSYADNAHGVNLGFNFDENIIQEIENINGKMYKRYKLFQCEYKPKYKSEEEFIEVFKKSDDYKKNKERVGGYKGKWETKRS